MAQQIINLGSVPNDGTGTPLRTSFQYTNNNFAELYTAVGPNGNNITCPGNGSFAGVGNFGGAVSVCSGLKLWRGLNQDSDSIGIGAGSIEQTSTGAGSNLAIGFYALGRSQTARNNVSIGNNSMSAFGCSSQSCVTLGNNALFSLQSGDGNVAIGSNSSRNSINVNNTVAIGNNALQLNQSDNNVCLLYTSDAADE